MSFAGIIQEVLCDPELTVAIFSFKADIAKAFLVQIKRELERNDELRRLYPDVLWAAPRTEAPKWSETEGLIVKRRGNPKEATIEAHGLTDGQPTSRHYDLLVYDDVVTDKSVTSPEQILKTTAAWELSDNLGKHDGVRKWHVGTRYHFGDTYGVILERGVLKPRIHPATDDGTLKGRPVLLTQERWDEVKTAQRSTVAAQMLLNPIAGNEAVFRAQWFRPYEVRPGAQRLHHVRPVDGEDAPVGPHRDRGGRRRPRRQQISARRRAPPHEAVGALAVPEAALHLVVRAARRAAGPGRLRALRRPGRRRG
ncbi:MAG TPA: hypothetical protein VK281_03860, partial [Xanthobacteraceae bacterium]|nr:hypothetical protein [Xanthobacteraceae bacterium]